MKLRDLFIKLHQRDGGAPVLINAWQLGAAKLSSTTAGTTIWCCGRQEAWYVTETVEEIDKLLDVEIPCGVTNVTCITEGGDGH